mgnify:CR=1 FL=1
MTTEYGKRLRAARKHANLTQMKLSELTGIPQSSISTAERESKGSADTPVFAKACGVDAHWLATGEGEMLPTPLALVGKPVAVLESGEEPGDAYLQIPEYDVRFAAGNGRTALFDELETSVPRTYRRDWFVREGINPLHCKCFKVHGDSMEPMLFDGDSVLVNLAETSILNGKVYAIRYGDELRIKRLYRQLNGTVILRSDNPSHLPRDEELTETQAATHIAIIGRVRDKSGAGGL